MKMEDIQENDEHSIPPDMIEEAKLINYFFLPEKSDHGMKRSTIFLCWMT